MPLRPDGSFTVRMSLPDRRQVIPVIASSPDGVEQRTIILAVERNTKVLEPVIRDPRFARRFSPRKSQRLNPPFSRVPIWRYDSPDRRSYPSPRLLTRE